jgi:DNA repair exonuclease SbcCD nuclease subunit
MSNPQKTNPIAVLISDVHYNLNTLEFADKAMRLAIQKANDLNVPLIVAGDLHDTKANLRGECILAMIKTFDTLYTNCYILRGNHDAINEKSKETGLDFLNRQEITGRYSGDTFVSGREIITTPSYFNKLGAVMDNSVHLIPYHHDINELKKYLSKIDYKSCVIMHQGLMNSNMGDYIQDKSAITKDDVAGLRVISGHYHTRQTIQIAGGKWDYIGNPYTLSWGEANDPEKGFQVLYSDGSLEFIPTNLRKHRIIICGWDDRHNIFWGPALKGNPEDLVWVKVEGTKEQLSIVTKEWLMKQGYETFANGNFKLTLHPTEQVSSKATQNGIFSHRDLLDSMIDSLTNTSTEVKTRIKTKWKSLV